MKIYTKKDLNLQETIYKKKNVILREDDTVHTTDVSGMVNALNKDGDVTVSNDNKINTIDVPVLTQNNKVNTKDLNTPEVKSALEMAKKTPNTQVDITANKVTGNIKPIGQASTTVNEGVVFTKREMNNFLRSI